MPTLTRHFYKPHTSALKLPDLIEVQTASYKWLFEEGIRELLDEISGIIPTSKFNNLMEHIINKQTKHVDQLVNELFLEGYSMVNQVIAFHNYIIDSKLTSEQKSNILCKIADIDQNLIKGCDEYIQFMKLAYHIMVTI